MIVTAGIFCVFPQSQRTGVFVKFTQRSLGNSPCFIWSSQIFLFVWGVRFCWYQYLGLVFIHKFIHLCQYFFFPLHSQAKPFESLVENYSSMTTASPWCFVCSIFFFVCLSTKRTVVPRSERETLEAYGVTFSVYIKMSWKFLSIISRTQNILKLKTRQFSLSFKSCVFRWQDFIVFNDSACFHSRWFIFGISSFFFSFCFIDYFSLFFSHH